MDADFARRAQALLEEALGLARHERRGFLDRVGRDDAPLRQELESLLRAHDAAGDFLDEPALGSADADAAEEAGREAAARSMIGRRIGRYAVRSVIASGGMGTVYLAEQDDPRRTVALKMMRTGLTSRSALQRFQYESRVLAHLQHPNIAQVFEAGMHHEGADDETRVPWFAMEHVAGAAPITEYAASNRLDTRERLALFARVCDAVNHGHQRGIVHRDLKPANILVAGSGEPKVIDFGIARATDADIAITTLRTDVGQLVGTLQYMSPEQCEADPSNLDARSDVYGLGVVLYELLCGRPPYDVGGCPVFEAARRVREETPTNPSTHDRVLRGDLETITLKALEKDRERRYQSAAALADDVRRFLGHEPIRARPPTLMYQARMFARRNAAFVGAVSAVMVVLVIATIVSAIFAVRAREERDAAVWKTYTAHIAAAESAHQAGEFGRMRTNLVDAPAPHRGWEWRHLRRQAEPSLLTLGGLTRPVTSIAVDAAGTRLAAASGDGPVRLWNPAAGAEIATLAGHDAPVLTVAFARDGGRLASGALDGSVRLWDAATGTPIHSLVGHGDRVNSVVFSADGRDVISGGFDRAIRFWDAATGAPTGAIEGDDLTVWALAVSADGARVAAGLSRTARVWDASTRTALATLVGHEHLVAAIALSPDGARVATASWDGTARVWDAATGRPVLTFDAHEDRVSAVAFSPDGARVATGSRDKTIRIWEASTGAPLLTLRGHEGEVVSIAFFADGDRLASGSSDRTIRVWETTPGRELDVLRGHERPERVSAIAFSPDGGLLASASSDRTVRLWSTATGETLARLDVEGELVSIAFSPSGAHIVAGGRDGAFTIWSATTGAMVRRVPAHDGTSIDVVFAPGGDVIATGSLDRTIALWDAETGSERARMSSQDDVWTVAFSPDGRRLAAGASDGSITVRDVGTQRAIMTLHGHAGVVHAVAFSPDGRRLASASGDRSVKLWDSATGAEVNTLLGHEHTVAAIAFSPDGLRLASGSNDKTVKLWDVGTGQELATLHGHERSVHAVAFSPDGSRLASASAWGEALIRFWDTVPRGDRVDERRATTARRAEMAPLVERLLGESGDPGRVAETLLDDRTLDPLARRAALDVLLLRASGASPGR